MVVPIRLMSRGPRKVNESGAMEPTAPRDSGSALQAPPSQAELFWAVLVIGTTCFGGAMTGFIEKVFVHDKAWVSGEEFFVSVEMARVMPGPNAVNLIVLLAKRLGGAPGAALAFVAIISPAIAANCLMGELISRLTYSTTFSNIIVGFGAAAVGLAAGGSVSIVRSGLGGFVPILIAGAAFVAVAILHLNVLAALLIFGLPTVLGYLYMARRRAA